MTSISPSLTVADPDALHATIAGHLSGTAPLAALDLYYELERNTSLLEFHTMLREGERNRTRDGLQQSYGDHNRLLMLALDRLLAGDVEWLRAHVAAAEHIDVPTLAVCASTAHALDLTPEAQVALWLGAAFHDCGMLHGQEAHVDVEDGVALARPVLEEYCPATTRPIAEFALRHHDYVKDTFLGEAPVGLVAEDLALLDPESQSLGLTALGLIQVAGAASLGEGRLTDFRLRIFQACVDGSALSDRSPALRLARLLAAPGASAAAALAAPHALEPFLDHVAVHGWHAFARNADTETRLDALRALSAHNESWRADHLVIGDALRNRADGRLPAVPATAVNVALSGSTVVTVLP